MAISLTPFREPAPLPIKAPTEEPRIRVGIALPEDDRKTLRITALTDGYTLHRDRTAAGALAPGVEMTVLLESGLLTYRGVDGQTYTCQRLEISAPPHTPLVPQGGLKVSPLIAGRIFHWRKEVEQTLPGDLELTTSGDAILAVNTLAFEDYCTCVIAAEMGKACPPDFLRAQITAARSWSWVFLRNKHPGAQFQICNDDDCQRYQGTTFLSQQVIDAVRATRGYFLLNAPGDVLAAYYSKSCGGCSEPPDKVFGFPVDGLVATPDCPATATPAGETNWIRGDFPQCFCSEVSVPRSTLPSYLGAVDETRSYFRWDYTITEEELAENLRSKLTAKEIVGVHEIEVLERGPSGRITKAILQLRLNSGEVAPLLVSAQYDLRRLLAPNFLLSSAFEHHWTGSNEKRALRLRGAGWGHGVGLCQIGAVGMSLKGYDWKAILHHYFPAATLLHCYKGAELP